MIINHFRVRMPLKCVSHLVARRRNCTVEVTLELHSEVMETFIHNTLNLYTVVSRIKYFKANLV